MSTQMTKERLIWYESIIISVEIKPRMQKKLFVQSLVYAGQTHEIHIYKRSFISGANLTTYGREYVFMLWSVSATNPVWFLLCCCCMLHNKKTSDNIPNKYLQAFHLTNWLTQTCYRQLHHSSNYLPQLEMRISSS